MVNNLFFLYVYINHKNHTNVKQKTRVAKTYRTDGMGH
jgi:hypothetical protein